MDTKLARGLTRQGIRQDRAEHHSFVRGMTGVFKPYIDKYVFRGRLKKDEATAFMKRIVAIKSDPHEWIFGETFSNPAIKSLSPDFDFALVGGCMSIGIWTEDDRTETVRSYSVFCDRLRRTSFEYRFHYLSLLIREHAISRYIEFADASYKSVSAALWPGLLILELFEPHDRTALAHPIMIPTAKGAFLGLRVLERMDDYSHRTFIRAFSSDMPPLRNMMPDVPKHGMRTYINTFVDENRLSDAQIEVRDALARLIEKHRDALMHAHLGKVMIVGREPDAFGLSTRYPLHSFSDAVADLGRLIQTDAWREGVRMPSDGVFNRYIELQESLLAESPRQFAPSVSV